MKTDFLIVGQGLAGSLIAWHLIEAGKRVLVVDRDEPETSSKVSAGLVTPLAGSRFHLPEGLEDRLDYARGFYWRIEEEAKKEFFHHRRIARLFRSEDEASYWRERVASEDSRYERFHAPLRIDTPPFIAPFGGFEMRDGGWLDVAAFLEHTRTMLLERASYAIARFDAGDLEIRTGGVLWKNFEASVVIFCEGWRGAGNRFFDWVPLRPSPGDILDLEIPSLTNEQRVVNKGGWLLPLGQGRFRAGSTYLHGPVEVEPSPSGRDEVLAKISGITTLEVQMTGHRRAIRPTIRRSQVFIGRHPSLSRIAFFNGLGSKGVLNGPWHAKRLAAHLVGGEALPPECDLALQPF